MKLKATVQYVIIIMITGLIIIGLNQLPFIDALKLFFNKNITKVSVGDLLLSIFWINMLTNWATK